MQVAQDQFCETTIGYTVRENGETLQQLFHTDTFHVAIVEDIAGAAAAAACCYAHPCCLPAEPPHTGVELCGALKNIVALGAGFCDGLGYGGNTKVGAGGLACVHARVDPASLRCAHQAAIIRIGLLEMMRFCKTFYSGVKVRAALQAPATAGCAA